MSKEVNAVRCEDALPRVDLQPRLPQALEDLLQVLKVLLQIIAPDDDVVDVAPREGQIVQHSIHPSLEIRRGVLQPEGDHQPFPQNTVGPPEGGLRSIPGRSGI